MAYEIFPDIDFDLAVKYQEVWKTILNQSEGEVEQRVAKTTRPRRLWTISAELDDEVDSVKDLLSACKGRQGVFLFRTRDLRSWVKVYSRVADGTNKAFIANFIDYTGLSIYDNGSLVAPASYSVANTGPAGTAVVTFSAAPTSGHVIETSVTKGRLVPLVRMFSEVYEDVFVAQGHYGFTLQLIDVKEDIVS